MSLFEDASLITTPNGYKAGKLYSIKPTNGDGDLTVVRATTATRVNSAGLIEEVAANVPRIDYTGGGCPSILVEPQRTNLVTYSEEFDNAGWAKSFSTTTPNDEIAPDGTMTADKIEGISTSFADATLKTITSSNVIHVGSVFIKKDNDETRFPELDLRDMTGASFIALQINTKTGETGIRGQSGNVGFFTPILINGYWRVSAYCLNVTNMRFLVRAAVSDTLGGFNVNITGSIYAWGAQLEEGSYATSYIPTVASAVTRNADVISKTGISALIGQTEGVLFAEVDVAKLLGTQARYILNISDGTSNNRIYLAFSGASSNILRARVWSGGVLQATIDTSTISTLGTYKLAMGYANNDIVFYVNGSQVGTDTSATIPACSQVNLGLSQSNTAHFNDGISQALLFKTRLTNAELEALTTL